VQLARATEIVLFETIGVLERARIRYELSDGLLEKMNKYLSRLLGLVILGLLGGCRDVPPAAERLREMKSKVGDLTDPHDLLRNVEFVDMLNSPSANLTETQRLLRHRQLDQTEACILLAASKKLPLEFYLSLVDIVADLTEENYYTSDIIVFLLCEEVGGENVLQVNKSNVVVQQLLTRLRASKATSEEGRNLLDELLGKGPAMLTRER
jgi:hypothetical protein